MCTLSRNEDPWRVERFGNLCCSLLSFMPCGRFNLQPLWFLLFRAIIGSISLLRSLVHSKAFWMHWLSSAETRNRFNAGLTKVLGKCCPSAVQSVQVLDSVKWSAQNWRDKEKKTNSRLSVRSIARKLPSWRAASVNLTGSRRRKSLRKSPQTAKGTFRMKTWVRSTKAFLNTQCIPIS